MIMAVLVFIGAAILFGLLASRFGADSRDGADWQPRACTPIHC